MNKTELIDKIAAGAGLTKVDAPPGSSIFTTFAIFFT